MLSFCFRPPKFSESSSIISSLAQAVRSGSCKCLFNSSKSRRINVNISGGIESAWNRNLCECLYVSMTCEILGWVHPFDFSCRSHAIAAMGSSQSHSGAYSRRFTSCHFLRFFHSSELTRSVMPVTVEMLYAKLCAVAFWRSVAGFCNLEGAFPQQHARNTGTPLHSIHAFDEPACQRQCMAELSPS